MDKYDLVLQIIEHPENFSSEQLSEFMADPEVREIYNLICKTDSAVCAGKEVDVNTEWKRFTGNNQPRLPRKGFWSSRSAAAVAAILGTCVAAVAIGIAVSRMPSISSVYTGPETLVVSQTPEALTSNTVTVAADSAAQSSPVMLFEDQTLEAIINVVAQKYNVKVKLNNTEAASMHLYFKLDTSMTLDEVVEQLNTFQQINITRKGDVLNID